MSDATVTTEPITKCPKCGALLINVVTGALCPCGCGGVFPKVPNEKHSAAVKRMRVIGLRVATAIANLRAAGAVRGSEWRDTALYYVAGKPGLLRRVRRESASLKPKKIPATDILAHDALEDRVVQLRLDRQINADVLTAMALETEDTTG